MGKCGQVGERVIARPSKEMGLAHAGRNLLQEAVFEGQVHPPEDPSYANQMTRVSPSTKTALSYQFSLLAPRFPRYLA